MSESSKPAAVVDADAGIFDVAKAVSVLKAGKTTIALCICATIVLAVLYLLVTPPVFRSDALLQVQDETNTSLPSMEVLQELSGTPINTADAEIQIIRSRSILGATVEKLNLTTVVEPHYFPLLGYAIARFRAPATDAGDRAVSENDGNWMTRFLWSSGGLRVARFVLPTELFKEDFTVRALSSQQYVLFDSRGRKVLSGSVGSAAEGETVSGHKVEIFVTEIEPSIFPSEYTLSKRQWLETVADLQDTISVVELGRDSKILSISLEGEDRAKITRIVNDIAETYLRQNVEARSEQAERRLEFLNQQLPELQKDVEAAEAQLNFYRMENRALDLGAEAKVLLDQVVQVEQRISEFQLKRAELRQTYTDEHPYIKAIYTQLQSLAEDRRQLENAISQLPETEKQMLGLQRDVNVNTSLYVQLLNNAQELRLMKAGTTGNVRIIDSAVMPVESVKPQTLYVLVTAVLFGSFIGAATAFGRAAFRNRLADPSNVEKVLGLPIYATIPFSDWQHRRSRKRRVAGESVILTLEKPDELANEAFRSLRTSIQFARKSATGQKVLITGPSPGVGKSFVSINLAVTFANSGKSVVLIDGDLRKGQLHRYLKNNNATAGLSDILAGEATFQDVAQPIDGTTVTLVQRGAVPPNPGELLMRPNFREFLEYVDSKFDVMLVDAAPVLAVSDAAVISSTFPDLAMFLIVRPGHLRIAEVQEAVRRLAIHQCKISGVVFNGVRKKDLAADSEHSYYYQYEY